MRGCAILCLAAACGQGAPAVIENLPGTWSETLNGREFIVYVPEKARGVSAPAVFMFHGTSGDGEKFYNISGWREKADAEGLIAVFPTALTNCYKEDENGDGDFDDPGEPAVTTKWMAWDWATTTKFRACTDAEIAALPADRRALADHDYPDDVAFVDDMVAYLRAHYAVDAKRLYATGFSNGAAFTARLAMERSETFASVASNSGALQLPVTAAERPLTYLLTFGSTDPKITALLGVTEIPVSESVLADFPALAATVQMALAMLQLPDSYTYSEVFAGAKKIAQFTYSTEFIFSVVQDLEHEYPNGKNHPLVMADALWTIFPTRTLP
jgi:polyhydroxybutyrate depolymerase